MGVEFVDRMTVEAVNVSGSDATIVNAARVSTSGRVVDELNDSDVGLLRRLIADGHTSTLEHCHLTVKADVTLDVRSEWHRHRVQSFNEKSGRYAEYEPRFYIEPCNRPLGQSGKSMDYRREHLDEGSIRNHQALAEEHSAACWSYYQQELTNGACREVARRRLPTNLMTQFYATANLSNWLRFIALRNTPEALYEIREAARQVEGYIAEWWPRAYSAYKESR